VKILIAEDEFTTRMLVQVSLENWGYRVESVVDGHEAWSILKQKNAPQIAILDWEMPELDGLEVCRRVKEMGDENPPYIILLTGRDNKKDIVQGFDAGADDYMTKPFNDNELRARVRVAERLVRTQTSLLESVTELKEVLNQLEMIQGGMVICQSCYKILSDNDNEWYSIQKVVKQHGDLRFIHAVCPDCTPE
jgi:sigma-B regulation protein RsbU (phosphoserine phosphatase)